MIAVSYQTGFEKGPRPTGYIDVSHDSGRTWRNERAEDPLGRMQGDDVVTFAGPGIALHTYICFLGPHARAQHRRRAHVRESCR